MMRGVGLPISGADGEWILSPHQRRSEIGNQYKHAQEAKHECDRLPWNEDHHSATSGERGNLRLVIILLLFRSATLTASESFSLAFVFCENMRMPTSKPGPENRDLAIHEAGHALMFDALGIPITFATIDEGCGGEESSYEGCIKLASETDNVCFVIAGTLAGPGASFFIAGMAMDKQAMMRFRSDQSKFYEIHRQQKDVGGYDEFWLRLQIFLNTWLRAWLLKHERAVEHFASDLLLKRTLSGDELANSLASAWDESKPDMAALRSDVISTLDSLLNTDRANEPHTAESDQDNGIQVYRLVDQEHDPIEVGKTLTRTSDHSNQKIAEGMYFALTREDAVQFSNKQHRHKYTHLLRCRLKGVTRNDLVDLIAKPNFFRLLKPPSTSPLAGLTGRALHSKYCEIEGKKGILWRAERGWTELCLLGAFVGNSVVIEAAEELA